MHNYFSYHEKYLTYSFFKKRAAKAALVCEAGDENRTRDDSMGSCSFTTKLHPHGGPDGIWTRDLLRDRQAC